MGETNITIFHLEDEIRKTYLLGCNLRSLFSICQNNEEKGVVIEYMLKELMKILKDVDETKFPKRGILFFIPELEASYKWYVNFQKSITYK